MTSYSVCREVAARSCDEVNLTQRECECLHWLGEGKTDDEIALILQRSRTTVRFHVKNLLLKLDVRNRTHAVMQAIQIGYLPMLVAAGGE